MYLKSLNLENFRSHLKSAFTFDPKINLIIGPNGSGKSNILESLYFLSCGKSLHQSSTEELISWQKIYSLIQSQIITKDQTLNLEVQISISPETVFPKKTFLIDNVKKTQKQYFGNLKVVVFQPEDIRLVAGSPSRRRDFLDSVFIQTEWRYREALLQYHKALKHRNVLLDLVSKNLSSLSELFYWNQSLVKNGETIFFYRQQFIENINTFFQNHSNLEIKNLHLNYHPSVITKEKLDKLYSLDLSKGFTHCGPHRDDFTFDSFLFHQPDNNLAVWGSRGQQRLAVLALRLGQIHYISHLHNQKPVLLLDDIFSELDHDHQQLVISVCHDFQTIFTSAEKSVSSLLPTAKIINL